MTTNSSASALRYRPQKFEEVIGQDAIVKTLLNEKLLVMKFNNTKISSI